MCSTSFVGSRDPQLLIWIDTQGCLTHIVEIFKFWDVSGPRATKWPKVNRWLKIVNYFTHVCGTSFIGSRDPQLLIWIDTQGSLTHIVEIFKFGDVSGPRATKWPKVNRWLKIVNYFTHVCGTSFIGSRDPQLLIWIDTQGCLTHIVEIFKFGDVSGPRPTKWPKVNRRLKIVNYFTHVWHFFCR